MISAYDFGASRYILGTRFDNSSSKYFTQNNYSGTPNVVNPIRALANTDELTIVTVAKPDFFNNSTGDTHRYCFALAGGADSMYIYARFVSFGSVRYWTIKLTDFNGTTIKEALVNMNDAHSNTWLWGDWYVIMVSYKKSPATMLVRFVNLTRGNEFAADQTGLTANTISPGSLTLSADQDTFFSWGWAGHTINFNTLRGTLSQTVIAPEFRDFTSLTERQKFATTAGVKGFEAQFSNPWIYTRTGDIRDVEGQVSAGALDFTDSRTFAHVDGLTPPLV